MTYSRQHIPQNSKISMEVEILMNYHEFLRNIEKENKIFIPHEVKKQHVDFFKLCFHYDGSLHNIDNHLATKGFQIVYNVGLMKIAEISELEKENIVKGNLLIGGFFNHNQEILRFIIGKRIYMMTLLLDNVRQIVSNIHSAPCH